MSSVPKCLYMNFVIIIITILLSIYIYSNMNNNSMNNIIHKSNDSNVDMSDEIANFIIEQSKNAIKKNDRFVVAFSGGSLPRIVSKGLLMLSLNDIEWNKWYILFADERVVSLDDDDSNAKTCNNELFQHVPIPKKNIITINPNLGNAKAVAKDYEDKIRQLCPNGEIDLILLGMGPDGHTCSLFPNHELLEESKLWIASIEDSPKPPPMRITMTIPLVSKSLMTAYVISGESKLNAVKLMLDNDRRHEIPAGIVRGQENHIFLDPILSNL